MGDQAGVETSKASCNEPQGEITGRSTDKDPFYTKAAEYWETIPATLDGMLGGFGHLSHIDTQGSEKFMKQVFSKVSGLKKDYACDCGAGIGRVTKNLLQRYFSRVDLVEQNPAFLQEADNYLNNSSKVGKYINVGLQDFQPEKEKYDLIWCQWVIGHLTDEDLIGFLTRCREGLKPRGVLVLKENIASGDKVDVDETDSSVTRPLGILLNVFKSANLKIIKEQKQDKFPKELFEVKMFALVPEERSK